MKPRAPFAVILDNDPGMALSLRHLFQAVCLLSAELCDTFEELQDYLDERDGPKVVIVGRVNGRSEILQALKSKNNSFVLVIDRGDQPEEAEEAFLAGADDVIRAPFRLRELVLRLRARVGIMNDPDSLEVLQDSGPWEAGAYIASHAGLTSAEAQIAHILISHNGEIVSRDALSYAIDRRPWEYGDRKFDVHVAKIRKKLTAVFGDEMSLTTVRAAGYVLKLDQRGLHRLMQ